MVLEDNSEHRHLLCYILVLSRSTTTVILKINLFFALAFRTFLILHAERGLLSKGKLNLKLFKQLFWLIVTSFVVIILFIVIKFHASEEKFAPGSHWAICILLDVKRESKEIFKLELIRVTFMMLELFYDVFLYILTKRFLTGHCPKGSFACIGKYKRNLISKEATQYILFYMLLSAILNVFSSILFINFEDNFSVKSVFFIWNMKFVMFNDFFFLLLPLLIKKPNLTQHIAGNVNFYVTYPGKLEPRRDFFIKRSFEPFCYLFKIRK